MGVKLSWTGLGMMLVFPVFGLSGAFVIAGAVVLTIGIVLQWLNQ